MPQLYQDILGGLYCKLQGTKLGDIDDYLISFGSIQCTLGMGKSVFYNGVSLGMSTTLQSRSQDLLVSTKCSLLYVEFLLLCFVLLFGLFLFSFGGYVLRKDINCVGRRI